MKTYTVDGHIVRSSGEQSYILYSGRDPEQIAFHILLDFTEDRKGSQLLHLKFRKEIVAKKTVITEQDIYAWIDNNVLWEHIEWKSVDAVLKYRR
jgi:hypothetical protein